jgi:nucleotide-binding universal stress UspA family protein
VFRHILLPTDLSGHAGRAADLARDLARPSRARITLLHVIEMVSGAEYDEFASFYQELEARAAKHLAALASRFEDAGLEAARTVLYGKPAEVIIRFADEQQADLLVLASHPVDFSRPGHGWSTLSYRIGVLARCPVLLVK